MLEVPFERFVRQPYPSSLSHKEPGKHERTLLANMAAQVCVLQESTPNTVQVFASLNKCILPALRLGAWACSTLVRSRTNSGRLEAGLLEETDLKKGSAR